MVLEESSEFQSAEEQGDFSDSSKQDFDTSPGNGKAVLGTDQDRWTVDLESLPRPFALASSLDWRRSPQIVGAVGSQLHQARTLVGRPLKQEEVDAIAFSFAKSMQWMSYALPTSNVASIALAWRGREQHQVPFVKLATKSWFNPEKFGPLAGDTARRMWHLTRFAAWQGWCFALASVFFGSMARTTVLTNLMSDPRMKDVRDARQRALQQRMDGLPGQPQPRQNHSIESREGQMDNQAMRAESLWRRTRPNQRPSQSGSDDDMSPTGGAFMDDVTQSNEEGLLSDQQMQMNERRQDFEAAVAERNTRSQTQQSPTQQQQRSTDRDGAASPFAPGGAWERVRREAAGRQSSGSTTRNPQPPPSSSRGDDFTFSQNYEDKQLAHAEAQKEFDARVERERQGGDFEGGRQSSGRDSSKRW